MKKKIFFIMLIIFIALLAKTKVQAVSNVTYFYGETINIKDENDNIEVLSDEVIIDTRTSKIKHVLLLQNNANNELETEITIPLENKELSTKVNDLTILINGYLVTPTNDNGEYVINTKILANEGKKLEIQYKTENDLRDARVIKYNLDNLKEKVIGKVKVDIIFDEVEIPLITGIYPGHYTFDNNTISVEYYNMKVNTITRDVIIEKETYNNLLYGRENSFSEEEIRIINNAKDWIENGIKIDYNEIKDYEGRNEDINNIAQNTLKIKSSNENYLQYTNNPVIENIVQYSIFKQIIKDNKYYLKSVTLTSQGGNIYNGVNTNSEIIYEILYKNHIIKNDEFDSNIYDLLGKKICVEFVETEQEKILYRVGSFYLDENGNVKYDEYIKITERGVLKARDTWATSFKGAKVIYVGEGIDGNDLYATEEEKIEYVNSIGADLYIRNELYSGDKENKQIGYYNNEDKEMAFSYNNGWCSTKEEFEKEKSNGNSTLEGYSNFEEFKNSCVTKLQNDFISKNCEVPTIVYFVAKIKKVDGKYIVESDKGSGSKSGVNGIEGASEAIQTDRAKQLISSNKQKNDNIKNIIENKILNIKLDNNEKEIQEELIKVDEPEKIISKLKLRTKDIIVLSIISSLICICVVILIINNKRRK